MTFANPISRVLRRPFTIHKINMSENEERKKKRGLSFCDRFDKEEKENTTGCKVELVQD